MNPILSSDSLIDRLMSSGVDFVLDDSDILVVTQTSSRFNPAALMASPASFSVP